MEPFENSLSHILAELERLDLLLRVQLWRARQATAGDAPAEDVGALLDGALGEPLWSTISLPPAQLARVQNALDQMDAAIAERRRATDGPLRMERLARHFGLSRFEQDVLLVCLAPAIDLRYARMYAHLHADPRRADPSIDLVLHLFAPFLSDRLRARRCFTADAPLFRHHLVEVPGASSRPPGWLGQPLRMDERIVHYLLGGDEPDKGLLRFVDVVLARGEGPATEPSSMERRLGRLMAPAGAEDDHPNIFYLQGRYGAGRRETAVALCRRRGMALLVADGEALAQLPATDFAYLVRLLDREARLQEAALYWQGFDALMAEERRAHRDLLWRQLGERPDLTFLAGSTAWEPKGQCRATPAHFTAVSFPVPGFQERRQLWQGALGPSANGVDLTAVAGHFRFSAGQIEDAALAARRLARRRNPDAAQMTAEDLFAAGRLQCSRELATLAQRVEARHTWDDLVLPPEPFQQLRHLCNQVKYRALVLEEWGFEQRLALGKGIGALFSGPPGTGKTMAASIIAGELGLDLYRVDLATVVSKYIGETEKNLSRLFAAAQAGHAILFFDEADALFGRRTEVRDAHDRYANLEVSYLLQQIESFEGIVILASNLRKNMDPAFVRRMHFIVDFPFPGPPERRRIWEGIWPAGAPRAADLDLAFLAEEVDVAGGNIRNIALAAAYLAAADGGVVTMPHLIEATIQEYVKMGKLYTHDTFGPYAVPAGGGTEGAGGG